MDAPTVARLGLVVRSIVEVAPLVSGTDLGYSGAWRMREDNGLFNAVRHLKQGWCCEYPPTL